MVRTVLRWLLGAALIAAGVGHLTAQRTEFRAQVPGWFPIDEDVVVVASGLVEIALGLALIVLARHRVIVGTIVAAFFVVIFPGNVAQWTEGVDAFGLLLARGVCLVCTRAVSSALQSCRKRQADASIQATIEEVSIRRRNVIRVRRQGKCAQLGSR